MRLAELVDPDLTLALLRGLLHFDTQNPPGHEEPAMLMLRHMLAGHGVDAEYFPSAPGRGNLLAVLPGDLPGPNLILNGHVDTQPLGNGWTRNPLGELAGNRIYGLGTGDMKSGIAAMAAAVVATARSNRRRAGDLIFLASADEVSGGRLGVGSMLERLRALAPSHAVVGEPTLGDVVIGARGVAWGELRVDGRPGQANKPGAVNAISVMAEIMVALEQFAASTFPQIRHDWIPAPTLNLGRIRGGVKENTVAAECLLHLDRRLSPGEDPDRALDDLAAIARSIAAARGARVSMRRTLHVPPSCIDPGAPLVAACAQAFARVTGRTARLRAASGFTDAHFFIDALGIDAVVFGPWYQTPHPSGSWTDIPDEFALIPEIVQGARIYAQLIEDLQAR